MVYDVSWIVRACQVCYLKWRFDLIILIIALFLINFGNFILLLKRLIICFVNRTMKTLLIFIYLREAVIDFGVLEYRGHLLVVKY